MTRMKASTAAAMAALLLSLFSLSARAGCEGSWNIRVDVNQAQYRQAHNAMWVPVRIIRGRSLLACTDSALLEWDGAAQLLLSGPGGHLSGQFTTDTFQVLNRSPGSEQAVYVPLKRQRQNLLWLKLSQSIYAPPGWYSGQLTAWLNGTEDQSLRGKSARVKIRVKSVATLSVDTSASPGLRGSGDHYYLDLGKLHSGLSRQIKLSATSNAKIRVSARSEHGTLQHTQLADETIPYRMRIHGKDFSAGQAASTNLETSSDGEATSIPLSIAVGEVDFAQAGKYHDTITVTFTAM